LRQACKDFKLDRANIVAQQAARFSAQRSALHWRPAAGVATRLWDFSVRDDDEQVRKDIDAAISGNRKVKLHYREKYFRWSWLGDTKHFVDKVELAG
jgi:hypothetical protein